jgi:hypothetical protein
VKIIAAVACVGSVTPAPETPAGGVTSRFATKVSGAIVSIFAMRVSSTRSRGAQAARAQAAISARTRRLSRAPAR